ncbi:unnamed protein product [Adineta steineri]|uniref:Uncharacterized protein n=1 Tax=Adineta steineri TaxID=433720 RepID=A0A814QY95_9BILA|nr:unnamed protein product [Adineta steineri]CAF4051248.1 unnamed protein product [Adineta steineri]
MVPYNQARRSQAMLHQFIQLNLTYPNNQTIDNNHKKVNHNTHRNLKYIISIVCITIVVIITIIGFLVHKPRQPQQPRQRQQERREPRQLVRYTIINNENDEPVTSDDDTEEKYRLNLTK